MVVVACVGGAVGGSSDVRDIRGAQLQRSCPQLLSKLLGKNEGVSLGFLKEHSCKKREMELSNTIRMSPICLHTYKEVVSNAASDPTS